VDATDFETIFAALEQAKVRYLVVGGVAVVLHGVLRFTADLDLVIALDEANALATISALARLGYRPRAPVNGEELANPATRRAWIEDKGLVVLSLWSPDHPATDVDIFVEEPFPFEDASQRAVEADLGTTRTRVASIADLVELKRRAGRPKDLADIEALATIGSSDDE
jgi:hypothetical protein